MSKKKGKTAKTASKKKAGKRTVKAAATPTRTARLAAAPPSRRTSQATIFLFRTGNGNKIRTTPQRAYAGPGHIEWTVVNLIDGTEAPVTITWPDGGPWGKDPIEVKSTVRRSCDNVPPGRYKYVVSAYDAQEDPEVEFPEN
jgi:hypothetical protein